VKGRSSFALLLPFVSVIGVGHAIPELSRAADKGPLPGHYACINYKYEDGADCNLGTVRAFVPAFAGSDALGLNVATVLNLQLFTTLRKAPTPNPEKLSFGDGLIVWDREPLSEPSHETAERAAKRLGDPVQLVLWGKASRYADGVLVQAYLTLPANAGPRARPEVWQLQFPSRVGGGSLELDIPSRRYAFEPVILDDRTVDLYSSPNALKIYRDKTMKEEIGTLAGGYFRAYQHDRDGEWLLEPMRGWVPFPRLSERGTEIVDFTGGLLRIFRADWNGAGDLLRKVLQEQSTPSSIRIDALLYLGLTAEKQKRSGRKEIEQAYAMNPLSQASAAYLIMSAFSDYLRAQPADRSAAASRIGSLLGQNRFLFGETSDWFKAATTAYQRILSKT
jgi:hypothetical protein